MCHNPCGVGPFFPRSTYRLRFRPPGPDYDGAEGMEDYIALSPGLLENPWTGGTF